MPKTICTYPGCNALVPAEGEPRCSEHPYARPVDERGSAASRGYDAKWRRLRRAYLADNPQCELAYEGRCRVVATEVDHRMPLRAGGQRLDEANLQAVCRECHQHKTRTIDPRLIVQYTHAQRAKQRDGR